MTFFRRFLIFTLGFCALSVSALGQMRDFGLKQLSAEEAVAVLDAFRAYRLPADYCMRFDIVHKPRKSDDETVYSGIMWGSHNAKGTIIRLHIGKAGAADDAQKRFLIQSGKNPSLWELNDEGKVEKVDAASTAPFFADLIFTPFDLQTPFLFWERYEYDRTRRYRARPVHFFDMFPPEAFAKANPGIGSVRIGFDRAYNALIKAEVCNQDGRVMKQFSLGGVRKIQGMYSFEELELRDETTRDRDTLIVRAAALRLRIPEIYFAPENLGKPPLAVPASAFEVLD